MAFGDYRKELETLRASGLETPLEALRVYDGIRDVLDRTDVDRTLSPEEKRKINSNAIDAYRRLIKVIITEWQYREAEIKRLDKLLSPPEYVHVLDKPTGTSFPRDEKGGSLVVGI